MQVAHQNDHITHAVIGGKQSIEFGISNSAEFFNILSSTLYKDQILAVVRETLCNAWDAHIEAGCTDRAVQVTLTKDKFIIKDFGKGIHLDDMGLIYGTYGNSTKKNDGTQTGGFGLGCKAPFAYTDHFEVTSCNAGIKTIYSLSKSSAQAQGKPGITPIASFPTGESGLTVSIGIQANDYHRFKDLIERISSNGDMNMKLNEKQLETIGFDVSKGNYLLTPMKLLDTAAKVMVRYGNVVYPVDSAKEIANKLNDVCVFLNTLRGYATYSIVFQAPAHSISVTPSRESLSMQEHTVNTLNNLFDGFLNTLKKEFITECDTYAKDLTHKAVAEKRIDTLLNRDSTLPYKPEKAEVTSISDLVTMSKVFLQNNYPQELEYRKKDITRRLELMVKEKLLDRGMVQTFLLAMKEVQTACMYSSWSPKIEKSSWLQRQIIAPLLSKLLKENMSTNNLYVCDAHDTNWEGSHRERVPPLVPATNARPHHLLATLPYLRNIIVITSKRDDLVNLAYGHEMFKSVGKYHGFLVYRINRKKGEAEAARAFFKKQGMHVVDLTETPAQKVVRTTPVPRKPVKKGLPCLSSTLQGSEVYTRNAQDEDTPRIEDPEFVINISMRQSSPTYSFDGWGRQPSFFIAKLFGDKGGVCTTSTTHLNWTSKGYKDADTYIREKVCAYLLNNPRIEQHSAINKKHAKSKVNVSETLVELIYSNKTLMKEFGITDHLTEEDKMYLFIFEAMENNFSHCHHKDVVKVKEWIKAIPISPIIKTMIDKLQKPILDILNTNEVHRQINSNNPQKEAKAITTLLYLLNN